LILLYISLGGFLGSILRYIISEKLNRNFPYGTLLVNITGSFLLGYFFSKGLSSSLYAFLGTGFCGAFTTFSTFKLEAFQLYRNNDQIRSFLYLFMSYLMGICLAYLGFITAEW
jgi:fluoride exporter